MNKEFWSGSTWRYIITAILCLVIWGATIGLVYADMGLIIIIPCAYYGWQALNRIQPSMFLWMSFLGWIIYFVVKFTLAFFIGVFVAPIVLGRKLSARLFDGKQ